MPLLFVQGITGKVFQAIPLIVIPCLVFSLVESLCILPAHLAHVQRRGAPTGWRRLQRQCVSGLMWFVRRGYQPVLEAGLRWRYVTAALGASALVLTGGAVLGGWATFHFFPSIEPNFITVSLTLPQGSPVDATSAALEKIEAGAARVRAQLLEETGMDYFRHIATTVGDQPVRARGGAMMGPLQNVAATNAGEVTIELVPAETRSYTGEQIGALWREATDPIPEAVELSFDKTVLNVGDDVDLQLTGSDIDRLRAAAEAVKRRLAQYSGVYAIADSFRSGTLEMHLGIEPTAENLGLRLGDLGRQVRQAFYGEEAQRIQRGRDDIRVMVRYPRDDRRSLGDLENMRIRTPDGGEVPFGYVARGDWYAASRRSRGSTATAP